MPSTTTPRIELAALTTTFIPPPDCTAFAAYGNNASNNVFYGAQSCQSGEARDWSTCWPPATITTQANPLAGFGFYSPGLICPSGFVSACTQIVAATDAASVAAVSTSFSFQYQPTAGETAVGCCPTGFTCTRIDGYGWQTCRQDATQGTLDVGICGSSGSTFGDVTRITLGPKTSLVYAPMFQLMFQSTDLPSTRSSSTSRGSSSSPSNAAATSTPSSSNSASNSASSNEAASSNDLSTGAKIGIGIGIPLAVIALVALGTFLFLRRRKRHLPVPPRTPRFEVPGTRMYPNEKSILNRDELAQPRRVNELADHHSSRAVHELPSAPEGP